MIALFPTITSDHWHAAIVRARTAVNPVASAIHAQASKRTTQQSTTFPASNATIHATGSMSAGIASSARSPGSN